MKVPPQNRATATSFRYVSNGTGFTMLLYVAERATDYSKTAGEVAGHLVAGAWQEAQRSIKHTFLQCHPSVLLAGIQRLWWKTKERRWVTAKGTPERRGEMCQ